MVTGPTCSLGMKTRATCTYSLSNNQSSSQHLSKPRQPAQTQHQHICQAAGWPDSCHICLPANALTSPCIICATACLPPTRDAPTCRLCYATAGCTTLSCKPNKTYKRTHVEVCHALCARVRMDARSNLKPSTWNSVTQ
jgi:hypothetical protein